MIKYFMSHSIKDKDFVDEFIKLLILGGTVPNTEIFCTSRAGDDIVPGKDFVNDIGEHLKQANIVFCFFSSRYLDSTFCMAELGASWILGKDIIPIIISDITFDQTTPLCRNLQGIKIDDEDGLHSLVDKIKHDYPNFKVAYWNKQEKVFMEQTRKLLQKDIVPNKISFEKYRNTQQKISSLKEENQELNETIKQKDEEILLLKNCKDKSEVSEIEKKITPQIEQFNDLCEDIKNTVNYLPDIVRELCFRSYSREDMTVKELGNYSDAKEAYQYKFIDDNGGYVYLTNKKQIQEARSLLNKIYQMIENANDSLYEYIKEQFDGNEADMSDKEFWIKILDIKL